MTKKPKTKSTDLVPVKTNHEAPTYGPGVIEVMLYTIGTGDEPICGHCARDGLIVSDKAVLVNWIDGGHTFVPMDAVDRLHWDDVHTH